MFYQVEVWVWVYQIRCVDLEVKTMCESAQRVELFQRSRKQWMGWIWFRRR